MKKLLLISIFLFNTFIVDAQIFSSSNLPIVIIDTDKNPTTGWPIEIQDEPKVPASMKIIFRPDGSRNFLTDKNNTDYLNYIGRIAIEKNGDNTGSKFWRDFI